MAAPTIGRRPRWAPGPTAQIDWSHPLAQGCVAYVLPAYAADLARQPVSVTGTFHGIYSTPSPLGVGASGFSAAFTYETVGVTAVPIVGDVSKSVITGVFHGVTAVPGGTGAPIYAERGSVGNPIANLLLSSTAGPGVLRLVWRDNGGTLINQDGTVTVCNGVAHVASWNRTSTTTFEMWVDGALDSSVTSGAMTTTFSEATLSHRIGGDVGDNTAEFSSGTIVAVILHRNRSLAPAEVAQLHSDPFCFLRY